MTNKQRDRILQGVKRLLRLDDWTFHIADMDEEDVDVDDSMDNYAALVGANPKSRIAKVIIHPELVDEEVGETILHECLHVVLAELVQAAEALATTDVERTYLDNMEERIVEDLTVALRGLLWPDT